VNQRRTAWAFQIGSVAHIPIKVHITFLILFIWLVFGFEGISPSLEGAYVLSIFACVLLHELGHALIAQRFGVQTRDITLYPFGGVASILTQPSAKAELAIALAGPLVNILIALALYPFATIPDLQHPDPSKVSFITRLFFTNVALAFFNLLPALPMDGGRVLRAILALCRLRKPTKVAARISQGLCVLLGIAAVYTSQPMLFVIAFIVFFGAMQEHVRAETKIVAGAFTVADAMIPRERLETLPHSTTIAQALHSALTSLQPLFPIVNGEHLLGVVFREDLLEHAATHSDDYVGEIITRTLPALESSTPLSEALNVLERSNALVASVQREGSYVGLLVYDRLSDFLLMHEIRRAISKDDEAEWSMPW
jgi:Zn-dependent protease/CBS domain-containing protein